MSKQYDYDAIIIGAGISGLVCGCYLAKAGMKVLIVEKNAKTGGYCTSFTRKGFTFDACVHSLGSLRRGGTIRTVMDELELEKRLTMRRHDPSDIIIAPDFKIHFWNNLNRTIQELQKHFPNEDRNVKEFIDYINACEGISFVPLRSITFQDLLDKYFEDDRLKAILSLPVLGNAGLPAKKVSALVGALIYKEFMLDGGYYPDDAIQAFPDSLMERFKEFGGEILCSSIAEKIEVEDKKVVGIQIRRKGFYSAKYVISNADATQTFLGLIGERHIDKTIEGKLKNLEPSLSMFILYLGMKKNMNKHDGLYPGTNYWFLPYYDIDKMYNFALNGDIDNLDWFLVRLLADTKSVLMLVNAPFKDERYWTDNKTRLIDVFIGKIEKIFPDVSSDIVFKDAATPHTLYKWTLNYKGAAYGWAGIPSQLAITGFTQKTAVDNLYVTGHWATLAQGISGVAYLGRDTSFKILNKEKML
jgi:phytoene dehydrogenase-like protein